MTATDMNETTPMPDRRRFGLQMEGLFGAAVYGASFLVAHSARAAADPMATLTSIGVVAVFLVGLLVVPTAILVPFVALRRAIGSAAQSGSSVAAAMPLAGIVFFLLQALLVWWATGEAYGWVSSAGLL